MKTILAIMGDIVTLVAAVWAVRRYPPNFAQKIADSFHKGVEFAERRFNECLTNDADVPAPQEGQA